MSASVPTRYRLVGVMASSRWLLPLLVLVLLSCSDVAGVGTGALDVRTLIRVTGTPDPNGFTLSIDGSAPVRIGHLDSFIVTGIVARNHRLVLGDIAPNCVVVSPNPLTVTVIRDARITEYFLGTC